MAKKVLLLNNGYPSHRFPQYTTYIRSIEECIVAAGCSVDKLVIKYERPITPAYKFYKYFIFWMKCLSIRSDCDVVYINHLPFAWPIILNPFISGKKIFVHWHGNDLIGTSAFLKLASAVLRPFVTKAQNITPSHFFSRLLRARFSDDRLRVFVSPSGGVDTVKFAPPKTSHNKFVISFASELKKDKGADIFLFLIHNKAEIERLTGRSIEFHYIKYGAELNSYLPRLNSFDSDAVKGYDKMPKEDMPAFMNSTDLLIFPSQRESESLGLVALEAMSCDVPVVALNACAFPEFIKPGLSGELVDLTDSGDEQKQAFMDSVVRTIKNIDKYNPRTVVEKFYSHTSVASFYRNLFV